MHATRNSLGAKVRKPAIRLLNARLADLVDLRSQVKQAHWNIKGPSFIALHELLDTIAGEVDQYADDVAERAVQLGGTAHGTARMAAASSSLKEFADKLSNQREVVEAVADRLAGVGASIRAAIDEADKLGDKGTADLFTNISRGLDKQLWFVESHVA